MTDAGQVSVQHCVCGFKVRFGPQHVGRTVRCRDCSRPITLGRAPGTAAQPETAGQGGDETGAYTLASPEVTVPRAVPLVERHARHVDSAGPVTRAQATSILHEQEVAKRRAGGFWGDAGRAFMFWTNPGNAVTLVVLVIMLVAADLLAFVPVIGLIASIVVTGMVWAFYLQVVVNSAGGDDDLPDPGDWQGAWESVFAPILKIICVSIVVALPALIAVLTTDSPALLIGLGALGGFLWPAALLVCAVAGPLAVFRLDAVLLTIARAFLPYLAIWLMLIVAAVAQGLAYGGGLSILPAAAYEAVDSVLFWSVVGNLSGAYTFIVMMITIGLFYRHFSDRFPWSAG